MAWYNDNEAFACDVLESNIALGRLPAGIVDRRSIADVRADDLVQHAQCHFFAGIGGVPYGLRLAGWPDDLAIWTGGFPCQDISVAGRGEGLEGKRSGLWWTWYRLIEACRPARLLIENVPALRTRGADDVLAALEGIGYACRAQVVGAEHVGSPHKRHRVWIVANRPREHGQQRAERQRVGIRGESLADATGERCRSFGAKPEGQQREAVADDVESSTRSAGVVHPAGSGLEGHGPDAGQPEGCQSRGAGVPAVEDTTIGGMRGLPVRQRQPGTPAGNVDRAGEGENGDGRWQAAHWPSRPGELQHGWEAPRLIERAVGAATDGLSRRLARWNKAGLKAVGNAVVPEVVAAVAAAWLDTM